MTDQNVQTEQIRKRVKQFYNEVARAFSESRGGWWDDLRFIKKYYKPGSKILDFGCGNGRLLNLLRVPDNKYWGVDISNKLIEFARKNHPQANFQVIDQETKLPFGNRQFNGIFSIAVFHHLTPQMLNGVLAEFNRVLENDGMLVVSVWHLWRWKYFKYLMRRWISGRLCLSTDLPFKDKQEVYWRFCHWWSKNALIKAFVKNGFKVSESGYTVDTKGKKRNIFIVARKSPKN